MIQQAAREALLPGGVPPAWGVVLGSGFDPWLEWMEVEAEADFARLGLPLPLRQVEGHSCRLLAGRLLGVPALVQSGRLHLYQGLGAEQVVAPVRLMASLGVERLLLTTAVGALEEGMEEGAVLAIADQINLTGEDPHTGSGTFPCPGRLYHPGLLELLRSRGLRPVVLAGVRGPSYETAAEARALWLLGAQAVCMSTVLEALAASAAGMSLAGVAVASNRAGSPDSSHPQVLERVRTGSRELVDALAALLKAGG